MTFGLRLMLYPTVSGIKGDMARQSNRDCFGRKAALLNNRNLDQRQGQALRFICERVGSVALQTMPGRDTAWTMSEEAAKVGAFYEALSQGDLDEAVEYLHREVEVRPAIGGVMDIKRVYSGRDGARLVLEKPSPKAPNKLR